MIVKPLLVFVILYFLMAVPVSAQTTVFSYQGSLRSTGTPASGNYDFEFKLFDSAMGGTQLGGTIQRPNVPVTEGIFTVSLDFGASDLPGANRFIEIGLRLTGGPGAFQQLLPRQQVTSAPYSIRSLNATGADNASQLGGVAANQYVVTTDPRMTDPREPMAGSVNYIQNQNIAPQAGSNYNISGTGTVNTLNFTGQINRAGQRFIGIVNPAVAESLFIGSSAGLAHTNGTRNLFIGNSAGMSNTNQCCSTYVGYGAGQLATAPGNAFFGTTAGLNTTTGNQNSFFGSLIAAGNTTGAMNSFFGYIAGSGNSTGNNNSFFGRSAGSLNNTGSNNTIIGTDANVTVDGLSFATAIGSGSTVGTSNTIQLGRDGFDSVSIGFFANATSTTICRNGQVLALCTSSRRYKENILPFKGGLDLIKRLSPITFDWKGRTEHDLGFIAEDVAEIEPLLVTHNPTNGQIEGVKYDRVSIALVNAVKEQQGQIEAQRIRIEALTAALCDLKPDAAVCR